MNNNNIKENNGQFKSFSFNTNKNNPNNNNNNLYKPIPKTLLTSQTTNLDILSLSNQSNLTCQLNSTQSIILSTNIIKINQDSIQQQRIILLTSEGIYNIVSKKGFIKSLVSKLINIQRKFTIKRKVKWEKVFGVIVLGSRGERIGKGDGMNESNRMIQNSIQTQIQTYKKNGNIMLQQKKYTNNNNTKQKPINPNHSTPTANEFILSIIQQSDYRYRTQTYIHLIVLLRTLSQLYYTYNNNNKKLAFYFYSNDNNLSEQQQMPKQQKQIKVNDFFTTKCQMKKKVYKKPKWEPVWLLGEEVDRYMLKDEGKEGTKDGDKERMVYERKKEGMGCEVDVRMFKDVKQGGKLVCQSSNNYYNIKIIKNITIKQIKQIISLCQPIKYCLIPDFIFHSQSKFTLYYQFLLGGNLSQKMIYQTNWKISEQLAYYYIAQLILIIEQFQKNHLFYGNFCLENVYINEKGYLRVLGIDKEIVNYWEGELGKENVKYKKVYYNINSYLPYISPQMILNEGYTHQVNLWKLGICSFRLLYGYYPFQGSKTKQVYSQILHKKLKPQAPNFLKKLLEKDKNKRISLSELKNNQVFNNIQWEKLKEEVILAPYQPNQTIWRKGKREKIVELVVK